MRFNRLLRWSGVSLALPLLVSLFLGCLSLGCVDPADAGGGATAGTTLYAFDTADAATNRVLIWDNVSTLYDADAVTATTRTISSDQFAKVKNLAWGGLAMDSSGNRLWLVGEGGDVVRVDRIRQQTGAIPSTEAIHFTLGNSGDRLSGGKFSQSALDPVSGTLYVMETNDTEARVWAVAGAQFYNDGAVVSTASKLSVQGDKGGTGLAAGGGALFAFFKDGSQVQFSTEIYNGARLRSGGANGFTATNVLIGGNAKLGIYGSLALDTSNNRLYFARHNQDAVSSEAPINVFTFGQFGSNPNQAPDKGTLGTAALNNLRVLAHPGNKDWLVALDATTSEAPTNFLRIFKNPSQTGSTVKTYTLGTGVKLKGIALDGSA